MKIEGTITQIGQEENIGSKYRKLPFVVTNNDGYEGRECHYPFEIFEGVDKSRIENFKKYNNEGDTVSVQFDINARENPKKAGQWFVSLSAGRVDTLSPRRAPAESCTAGDEVDSDIPF